MISKFFNVLATALGATIALIAAALVIGIHGNFVSANDLSRMIVGCPPFRNASSSNMVILRLDDVQAYTWPDISKRVIEDTTAMRLPLVAGVIPANIDDDPALYAFLQDHHCSLEFAVHGWDHIESIPGRGEFAFRSYEEAAGDIHHGKAVIEKLAREKVTVFIPPNNEHSTGTAEALREAGLTTVSSFGKGQYDYDATTYDFAQKRFFTADEVVAACNGRFAGGDPLCVIMIHPQDFVTNHQFDGKKYKEYQRILSVLSGQGVSFGRFKDVNRQ